MSLFRKPHTATKPIHMSERSRIRSRAPALVKPSRLARDKYAPATMFKAPRPDTSLEENISVMHAINDRQVRFAIDIAIRPRDFLLILTSVGIILLVTELFIQAHAIAACLMRIAESLQGAGELLGVATAGMLHISLTHRKLS